jgi:hypothetical protein
MTTINRPDEPSFEEVVLEAIKVAARAQLSPQLARDLDVRVFQDAVGFMTDRLTVELRTHVYGNKIGESEHRVPWSKEIEFLHTETRHFEPNRNFALAALLVGVAGALWLPVFVTLALAVLLALGVWKALAPIDHEVTVDIGHTVSGEVVVVGKVFDTFPDNARVFPKEFGAAHRIVMPYLSEVTSRFEPPKGS